MNLTPRRSGPTRAKFSSLPLATTREGCAIHPVMLPKWLCMTLLTLVIQDSAANTGFLDVTKYDMIYYNPTTRLGLKGKLEDVGRDPSSGVAFRGIACSCEGPTCGCCAGINITAFKFDRRACTNFTYVPEDFAVNVTFMVNDRVLIRTGALSAKNPDPICLPFYLPFISFCVRFFDIYMSGKNLHACMDLETRVVNWPVLILHFDCVKIGEDGISWMKPEDYGSAAHATQPGKPEICGPEEYDHVDFEPDSIETSSNQTSSTLTPEEEDHIGQLKL